MPARDARIVSLSAPCPTMPSHRFGTLVSVAPSPLRKDQVKCFEGTITSSRDPFPATLAIFCAAGKWRTLARQFRRTVEIIICRCRGRRSGAERDREREASFFPLPKILRVSSAAHGAERKAEERGRMGAVTTYSFGVASFCILGIYRPRTAAT